MAGLARTQFLAGTHSLQHPAVHLTGPDGQLVKVLDAAQHADVAGVVDNSLDPQRPAGP